MRSKSKRRVSRRRSRRVSKRVSKSRIRRVSKSRRRISNSRRRVYNKRNSKKSKRRVHKRKNRLRPKYGLQFIQTGGPKYTPGRPYAAAPQELPVPGSKSERHRPVPGRGDRSPRDIEIERVKEEASAAQEAAQEAARQKLVERQAAEETDLGEQLGNDCVVNICRVKLKQSMHILCRLLNRPDIIREAEEAEEAQALHEAEEAQALHEAEEAGEAQALHEAAAPAAAPPAAGP